MRYVKWNAILDSRDIWDKVDTVMQRIQRVGFWGARDTRNIVRTRKL